jgi:hypothetical protein
MKMFSKSMYLMFWDETPPNRKTKVICVISMRNSFKLGEISWYGPWRQYCFFPSNGTIFNTGCMQDVITYIKELMEERKNDKSTKKSD